MATDSERRIRTIQFVTENTENRKETTEEEKTLCELTPRSVFSVSGLNPIPFVPIRGSPPDVSGFVSLLLRAASRPSRFA